MLAAMGKAAPVGKGEFSYLCWLKYVNMHILLLFVALLYVKRRRNRGIDWNTCLPIEKFLQELVAVSIHRYKPSGLLPDG